MAEPTRIDGDLHVRGNLIVDGKGKIPTDPSSDGTYVLQNSVSDGEGTLSWGSGGGGGSGSVVNIPITVSTSGVETTFTLGLTWAEIDELTDAGAVLYHKVTADSKELNEYLEAGEILYLTKCWFYDPSYAVCLSKTDSNMAFIFYADTDSDYPVVEGQK